MKKCTFAWSLFVVALLACGGLVYKFIFQGAANVATDGRMSLGLTAAERDLVLGEMRLFLVSVQKITQGVAKKDFKEIAVAARSVGAAAAQQVPGTLIGKLPLEFKKLGFSTHDAFDELAINAEQFQDMAQVSEQLSVLMQNCVACHSVYRIDVAAEK